MNGTEDNNIFSRGIVEWDIENIVSFIHTSDLGALECISSQKEKISMAAELCIDALKNGSKVIYAGAGTSGRIAVQDIAELLPTYGIGENMFDYIIAGGDMAIRRSVEGAEDSMDLAVQMLKEKNLKRGDVVVGITASGTTPFVISALEFAKVVGAHTISICNNKGRAVSKISEIPIELLSGPEVIQGSTRMKAGTSQKMVLNIISTTVAVKLGYTYKNTMVRMQSWANEKLRKRAIKTLHQEFGISSEEAESILEKVSFRIEEAVKIIQKRNSNTE
jgi:N-acetylmuramic acid 6-phosphate etherase